MAPDRPQPPGYALFQLQIVLQEVKPVVWRRILVPGTIRLPKFSEVLLAAMGWTNSHLHQFRVDEKLFGMHADDWPDEEIDEKGVTVLQALGYEQRFRYDYDFGDGWEHEVVVEDLSWPEFRLKYAVCFDGENACPPEDVGGAGGYTEFLEAVANPAHNEHERSLEWAGGPFDPAAFDLGAANAALQQIR
jgi:hypothetical protein